MVSTSAWRYVEELRAALRRAYGASESTLSDEEMVYVAIAYNRGTVNFARGFKQGYRDEVASITVSIFGDTFSSQGLRLSGCAAREFEAAGSHSTTPGRP